MFEELKAIKISKVYGKRKVVDEVDIYIKRGAIKDKPQ